MCFFFPPFTLLWQFFSFSTPSHSARLKKMNGLLNGHHIFHTHSGVVCFSDVAPTAHICCLKCICYIAVHRSFVRSFFSFCSSPRTTKNTLITPSLLLPASFFSPFSRQSWKPDTHSHSPAHNGPSHLHCSSLKQWQANWLKDCMCAWVCTCLWFLDIFLPFLMLWSELVVYLFSIPFRDYLTSFLCWNDLSDSASYLVIFILVNNSRYRCSCYLILFSPYLYLTLTTMAVMANPWPLATNYCYY